MTAQRHPANRKTGQRGGRKTQEALARLHSARSLNRSQGFTAEGGGSSLAPLGRRSFDELWAYDEPHESGGNCHITMTRRQAIDWFYKVYLYPLGASDDESLFTQWCALHWAYREPMASPSAPKEQARQ